MADPVTSTLTRGAIRAEIDALAAKRHGVAEGEPRVVGLRGTPDPALTQEFAHTVGGQVVTVRVQPCESTLAVWEALAARDPEQWLVVITDRPEDDLGTGVLAHFIGQRVRLVDPWLGVRGAFGASGIDRSLTRLVNSREVAQGLLAIVGASDGAWPAAPGGLLTLDHVATAVARRELGFGTGVVDGTAVVRWTTEPTATPALAALRKVAGDPCADALVRWLADRTDAAAPFVHRALKEARPDDVVPWGLAAHVVRAARAQDAEADAAWERLRALAPADLAQPGVANALGATATLVAGDLLETTGTWDRAVALLERANTLLDEADAQRFAAASPLLPEGLAHRLRGVGTALREAPDHLAVPWAAVRQHALVHHAPAGRLPAAVAPTEAAVRLQRWLATDEEPVTTLAAAVTRQVRSDAWVDSAIHDAAGGVTDTALSVAIADVVTRARKRRADHDAATADALVRSSDSTDGLQGALPGEGDPVLPLEHVLRERVAPLAKEHPALLLVLDGMTARVAAEVLEDLTSTRWVEGLWPDNEARAAAVALLPTLTEHSRTSLLCGTVTTGDQHRERVDHPKLMTSLGAGPARIFHKADLDAVEDGHRLAGPVRDAITNVGEVRLVTCVLNTIDDALDRSDPEGTDWGLASIKHLEALLEIAAAVGRPVVITSDHGHVLERRKGRKDLPAGSTATSARSRTADVPARAGEVLVRGDRVAQDQAVLAVDELLRYTTVKAGYHGGGAAAEIAVPLVLLWPGPAPKGYREAAIQRPSWWDHELVLGEPLPTAPAAPVEDVPALFDLPVAPRPESVAKALGSLVVASKPWKQQRAIAGRVAVSDDASAALLDALATAPGTRLTLVGAARALEVPERRARGAVVQMQSLANVDGYPVIRVEGETVVLDLSLLTEQFGVSA